MKTTKENENHLNAKAAIHKKRLEEGYIIQMYNNNSTGRIYNPITWHCELVTRAEFDHMAVDTDLELTDYGTFHSLKKKA